MMKPSFCNLLLKFKRAMMLIVLLGCSCMLSFAEEQNILTLVFNDGHKQTYVLADKPKVTFDATTLYVKALEVVDEYAMSDVHKFTFDKGEPDAIAAVAADECRLTYVDGRTVSLEGLTAGCAVRLFDTAGCAVAAAKADAAGFAELSLDGRQAGVYVLHVEGGRSFKLVRK